LIVLSSFPPAGVSALRQLRSAGIEAPVLASESWDGDYWLEGVPGLKDFYFVSYASVFGTETRPPVIEFLEKFQAKHNERPVTAHALTGYSVIEAWTRAVERAGTLDAEAVRAELEKFKDEPLLAGPTTYTETEHINMQRDLALMEVVDGKTGNWVAIVRAEQMPE
jgi:branched-chain amino acid transport system substrate-binding protein